MPTFDELPDLTQLLILLISVGGFMWLALLAYLNVNQAQERGERVSLPRAVELTWMPFGWVAGLFAMSMLAEAMAVAPPAEPPRGQQGMETSGPAAAPGQGVPAPAEISAPAPAVDEPILTRNSGRQIYEIPKWPKNAPPPGSGAVDY